MRHLILILLPLLTLTMCGCATGVDARGTSSQVYQRTRDAVLRNGFQIAREAPGRYGERPTEGKLDVEYLEDREKFEASRFVSIEISPFGDTDDVERTVWIKGWKYTWVSVITFRAYTSHQSDIQRLAASAVRAEFDQTTK